MKNCPNCQQPLADDARFCPACGNAMPVVAAAATPAFCPQCGSPMEEGSKFCTECGASVAAIAAAVVPPVAPPVTPPSAAPVPAEPPRRKKRTGLLIGIWTAGIAILLVLALLVSWSFGLFGGGPFGEGGLFGTVSSQSDDDDDDDDEKKDPSDPSDPSNPSNPGEPSVPDDYPPAPSEPVPLPKPIEHIELTVWAPEEAITSGWLSSMEAAFEERYRDSYVIRWENQAVSEVDAVNAVSQDILEAGDVYMFVNDQLGTLLDIGALQPLSGDVLAAVQENTAESMLNTVTHGDRVYGIPYTGTTWFMYYDKSVFTEEDIKSLDAMLAKDKVAFPLDNGWYLSAFYFANGGTIYGPGGTNPVAGIQFGGEAGTAVTNYLVDLVKHPNFSVDQIGHGHADFKSGKVKAYFSGDWEYEENKKALGDNLGCAVLPSITIDGQQKQMCAFANSKSVGVNPYADNLELAQELAAFLTSAEAQLARYQLCGTVPCDASLMDAMEGAPAIQAMLAVFATCARVQPTLPWVYWSSCSRLAEEILRGLVTHGNAAEKTEEFNAALNPGL